MIILGSDEVGWKLPYKHKTSLLQNPKKTVGRLIVWDAYACKLQAQTDF